MATTRAATGTADGGNVQDRAIFDRLDLRRQLVVVAVFLEISFELNRFEKHVPVWRDIVDSDILCPPKMGIDAS
ncbi:hypothetical protein ABIF05_007427 [Bradyrhizobium elkanii]